MSRTISTVIGLMFLILFVALFGLTGCEKIVEVKVVETDTLRIPVTRKGPGFVRFVSMLPGPTNVSIALRKSSDKNSPFYTIAEDRSGSEFYPFPDSTATQVFAHFRVNGVDQIDSFWVPWLNPGEMITCAIFQVANADVQGRFNVLPVYSNDSLRLRPAAEGKAYLRLINGLSDYPSPEPMTNLALRQADAEPIFTNGTEPGYLGFSKIHNYVEVPIGLTQVYVKAPGDPTPLYSLTHDFKQGGYYTARLVGFRQTATDRFVIDTEN